LELAKLLLEEGCSAGARNATTHSTALHVAVKRRSVELVNLLLEYGADPLVTDKVSESFAGKHQQTASAFSFMLFYASFKYSVCTPCPVLFRLLIVVLCVTASCRRTRVPMMRR
jgi:hypothetical protein